MATNDQYATWKGLAGSTLTLAALMGGMISWGWTIHSARPHAGSATHGEFIRLADQAREDRKNIEEQLIRMEDKIDNLELAVQALK